jgi:DNA polymerase-1
MNGYLVLNPFTKRRIYFPDHDTYVKGLEVMNLYHEKKYQASVLGLDAPEYPKEIAQEVKRIKSSLCRKAQNFPIQGTSADMTKIALVKMYEWIRDNNKFDTVRILLSLHDEIVLEVREGHEDEANKKLAQFMTDAGSYFMKSLIMESDGGPTKVWDH